MAAAPSSRFSFYDTQLYQVSGRVLELIEPSLESVHEPSKDCTVLFEVLHGSSGGGGGGASFSGAGAIQDDVSLEGKRFLLRGKLSILDRFVELHLEIQSNPRTAQQHDGALDIKKQLSPPKRLPFSRDLFAEMLFHFSKTPLSSMEQAREQANLCALEVLHNHGAATTSSSSPLNPYETAAGEYSVNLWTDKTSSWFTALEVVKDRFHTRTVYFYMKDFLLLLEAYPNKGNRIREMAYKHRSRLAELYVKDPAALCYASSAMLHYNPMGMIGPSHIYSILGRRATQAYRDSIANCPRVVQMEDGSVEEVTDDLKEQYRECMLEELRQARKEARLELISAWYYHIEIRLKRFDHRRNKSSTRIRIDEKGADAITSMGNVYEHLFVKRKVLILEPQRVALGSDLEALYLVERQAHQQSKVIAQRLGQLLLGRNSMPPENQRKLWLENALRNHPDKEKALKRHLKYIKSERQAATVTDDCRTSDEQREAITMGVAKPLAFVTGGPGTGKTTMVLRQLVSLRPLETVVATYTGKATYRVLEVLPEEVKKVVQVVTLDHIITLLSNNPGHWFEACTTLVIDEASSVSESKLARVLRLLPYLQQLIMVGDANQLTGSDRGFPFRDMLDTMRGQTVRLTRNFRADDVHIHNSRCILDMNLSDMLFSREYSIRGIPDCVVRRRSSDIEKDLNELYQYLQTQLSSEDLVRVQFITSFNRTRKRISAFVYNRRFAHKNPYLKHLTVGQRVIFLKNFGDTMQGKQQSDGVRNGETATLYALRDVPTRYNPDRSAGEIQLYNTHAHGTWKPARGFTRWATVGCDDGSRKNVCLDEIAYTIEDGTCITTHKSQGSEYNILVIVCDYASERMCQIINTNAIYTGYTRAKTKVIILYQDQVVNCNSDPKTCSLGSFACMVLQPRPYIDTFLGFLLQETLSEIFI